jgi:hypothetical protein
MTEEELAEAAGWQWRWRGSGARRGRSSRTVPILRSCPRLLRVACRVELAARAEVGVRIRRAREDGLSGHEIGGLLGFGLHAPDAGVPVALYAGCGRSAGL